MLNSKLLNNIIMCLCINLTSRRMIFQSNWTSFERRKSPLSCLCSLLKCWLTHTPACLFLILSAEMKDRSGTKDQLRAFCFSHPNLLLYFYSSRICGISPLWETTQQLGPLCHLSTASGGAQKEPGAVAEQQFQFEYSYLTLQTTVDTSKPCVRQNDVKLSIIKPLFSHTPEMSCS